MMEFFDSLPDSQQKMAWHQLGEELLDAYVDSTDWDVLEERLMECLDEVITEKKQTFASKMEEYYVGKD